MDTYSRTKHFVVYLLVIAVLQTACSKSADEAIVAVTPCTGTQQAGPLFASVKQLLQTNCTRCHSGSNAKGGRDFTSDCVIVSSSVRIKERAVDGNPSFMPLGGELSAVDKKKITDWIAAGSRFID